MEKSDLRKYLFSVRANIADRDRKDKRIAAEAIAVAQAYRTIFCYVSMGNEVSTRDILRELLANKSVYVPYTDTQFCMTARRLLPHTEFDCDNRGNVFPVGEPLSESAEVIFVPLLGYNRDGYRIGYGAGCYDRYFARYPSGHKVGLAYREQCIEDWRPDATDIPLDCILTPDEIVIPHRKRS